MPTPVKMPRLGESVAEGTIGGWLKKEGDWVERDESLAEIITDKINAELPSPVEGRLLKILVQTDETVPVGTDIALIEAEASVNEMPTPVAAPAPVMQSAVSTAAPVAQNTTPANNGARIGLAQRGTEERQRISPLARRLAREHDLDLNAIPGSGSGGRVRKEDILAYIEQRQAAPAAAPVFAPIPVTTQPTPVPVAASPVAPYIAGGRRGKIGRAHV